jgi:hypothetical protein
MAAIDVDGDGKLDLLAGNVWLKHRGGTHFDSNRSHWRTHRRW